MSANTSAVAALDIPFANDSPTFADIELLTAKINELITALHRQPTTEGSDSLGNGEA